MSHWQNHEGICFETEGRGGEEVGIGGVVKDRKTENVKIMENDFVELIFR